MRQDQQSVTTGIQHTNILRKETQVGSQGRSNEDHFTKSVTKVPGEIYQVTDMASFL
jgi:hypothetical protein